MELGLGRNSPLNKHPCSLLPCIIFPPHPQRYCFEYLYLVHQSHWPSLRHLPLYHPNLSYKLIDLQYHHQHHLHLFQAVERCLQTHPQRYCPRPANKV